MIGGVCVCIVGYKVIKRTKDTPDPFGMMSELKWAFTVWGPIVILSYITRVVIKSTEYAAYDPGGSILKLAIIC